MFTSYRDYWKFKATVTSRMRFFRDKRTEAFLGSVLESAKSRVNTIAAGRLLWRAQVGRDSIEVPSEYDVEAIADEPYPFPVERMKPRPDCATPGRVNPDRIPCLYLATRLETAIAEVRPWVESYVSVGRFYTVRDLRIVNCTTKRSPISFRPIREPKPAERARYVWDDIDRAYFVPVSREEDVLEYLPTQVLSELFRVNGFHGVAYHSALGKGLNIALFDLECAELDRCYVYQVRSIAVEAGPAAHGYIVKRRCDPAAFAPKEQA
jgi:hypothetical protein